MDKTLLENKITEYWHLAKAIVWSRYDRLQQVKTWLLINDSELVSHLTHKQLYLLIDETTAPTKPI